MRDALEPISKLITSKASHHHNFNSSANMSGQGSVSTNGLKPTYNASGLTTITNPAAPGKVLIIHTNKHRSLSLEHRGIGDKQSANKIEPEKFEEFIPELLYPSDLVTRHYDNWVSLQYSCRGLCVSERRSTSELTQELALALWRCEGEDEGNR
jgi:hypothetical protein